MDYQNFSKGFKELSIVPKLNSVVIEKVTQSQNVHCNTNIVQPFPLGNSLSSSDYLNLLIYMCSTEKNTSINEEEASELLENPE